MGRLLGLMLLSSDGTKFAPELAHWVVIGLFLLGGALGGALRASSQLQLFQVARELE
jgi:hypothetical protein